MGDRRQLPPLGEIRRPRGLPDTVRYPLIGCALGVGSPIGAFLMRYLNADPVLVRLWAWVELDYNKDFYIYMAVGSITAFMLFGYALGRYSDRQLAHSRRLAERVEDLHLQSVTDGLTGVYSHAYLMETLSIELERSRRHRHPVSVLMLDLDDFKKINDTHGHLFGDQVLKEVTETMSMNVRQEDVLGRYGGEEFLAIMPGADAQIAERVAQRVCKAVARRGIIDESAQGTAAPVKTTLSIGIATFTGVEAGDAKELIGQADKRLYKAKSAGKNQVVGSGVRI